MDMLSIPVLQDIVDSYQNGESIESIRVKHSLRYNDWVRQILIANGITPPPQAGNTSYCHKEISRLIRTGCKDREISMLIGCSVSTVSRRRMMMGIRSVTKAERAELMWRQGFSDTDVITTLGMNPGYLSCVKKKYLNSFK